MGYLITGIKDVTQLAVGDTLTVKQRSATEALPGYRDVKPMVFCGLFPMNNDDYPELRDALEKLTLNDAALSWEPETSDALGFGFRCGFLGLLHMDIVRERLEREYDLELMATMPSVEFEITLTDGSVIPVHNPTDMPDPARIAEVREPYIRASILTPKEYIGQIMELCQERRGNHAGMHYLSSERVQLTYDLPLAEIVLDFFDQLKTRTKGYASLDYEPIGLRPSALVKLDVLLGGDAVDALSMVVHKDKAYEQGKQMTERLRKRIPRQQYDVPIQAAVGAKIIARETVKAFRKDVTAKCYGGDISRKRKLLEKQKEGKRRMKQVGRIEVPQEAFLAVLELGDDRGARRGTEGRFRAPGGVVTRTPISSAARRSASTRRRSARPRRSATTSRPRAAAGYDDVVAPPMFAAVYSWHAMGPTVLDPEVGIDFSRMVHGGQDFTWHAPVVAGDEITTEASFVDQAKRGGINVFTFSSRSVNQRGELVCEGTWTNFVR